MLFPVTIGILLVLGIVSSLPLKASLITSLVLLVSGLSYYTVVPIVKLGVFPTGFFISSLLVITVLIWVTVNNGRVVQADRIRKNHQ